MNSRWERALLIGVVLILFNACTAPLYEISETPIETGTEQGLTLAQVETAIKTAGEGIGWKMKSVKPGEITGTFKSSRYTASVRIPYSPQNYSIFYKGSQNLKYDGAKIHKKYNELVQNLSTAIGREMNKTTGHEQPQIKEAPTTIGSLMDWLRSEDSAEEKNVAAEEKKAVGDEKKTVGDETKPAADSSKDEI